METKNKLLITKGQELPPQGAVYEEVGVIEKEQLENLDGNDVTVFKPGTPWSNTEAWNGRDEIHLDVAHYVKQLTYIASQHGTNSYEFLDEMCRLFDARGQKHPQFWEERPHMVIDIANECLHQTNDRMIMDGVTEIITGSLKKCNFITAEIPDEDEKYIEEVYNFDEFVKGMGYKTGDKFTYYRFTPAREKAPATYDLTKPIWDKKAYNRPAVINLQTWKAFFDRFYMFKDSEWEEDTDWIMELLYSKRIQNETWVAISGEAESILRDAETKKEIKELRNRLQNAGCDKLTGSMLDDIKALLIRDLLLTNSGVPIMSEGHTGKLYKSKVHAIYTKTGVTSKNKVWKVAYSLSKHYIEVKGLRDNVKLLTNGEDNEDNTWTKVNVDDEEYLKLTPTQRTSKLVRGNYSITTVQHKGSVANLSPGWDGKLHSILNPMKTRMWGVREKTLASAWETRRKLNKNFPKFKGVRQALYSGNVKAKIPELEYRQTIVFDNSDPFRVNEKTHKLNNFVSGRGFRVGRTVVVRYDNRTGMYEMVRWPIIHYQPHSGIADDWDGSPTPAIANAFGGPTGEAGVLVDKIMTPKTKKKTVVKNTTVVEKKGDKVTFRGGNVEGAFLEHLERNRALTDAKSGKDSSLEEE